MANNGIYQDLGNIIPSETIANGAIATSEWFDNYYWVRRFLFKIRANGNYTVVLYRRNTNNIADWSGTVLASTTPTSTAFAPIDYSGLGGYSFKIGIVNNSGGDLEVEAHLEVFR